jgi:hypothetical protein
VRSSISSRAARPAVPWCGAPVSWSGARVGARAPRRRCWPRCPARP